MNILMVSPFDLVTERLWGPTLRLHSLAKAMIKRGHNVTLIGPPPFNRTMPSELDGVPLLFFTAEFHRYTYNKQETDEIHTSINLFRRIPFVMLGRFFDFIKMTSQLKIDVLYVNRVCPETSYPALLTHFLKRLPIVCDWDDLEGLHGFSTSYRKSLKYQLMETLHEVSFPRIADATVVASRYLETFACGIGVKVDRLFYAPTVADTDLFRPDADGVEVRKLYGFEGKMVLLYCGNLMAANGVKVSSIIHTLYQLLKRDLAFRLLVVGDGDLVENQGRKGDLVLLAEKLGIQDKVVFTGGIPYREVPSHIAAADLCLALFPVNLITMSKSPLKVYEYMAAGKAVAARSVGELEVCIRDGINGILVYSDDPSEYADKIYKAFTTDGALKRMGEQARLDTLEMFSWSNSADIAIHACSKAVGTAV